MDFPLALGNNKSNALGAFEVSIKKTNNKKTMSVIEDMLNSGLTLFLPFNFIWRLLYGFVQQIQKLYGIGLHFMDHLIRSIDQMVITNVGYDSYDQSRNCCCHGGINS